MLLWLVWFWIGDRGGGTLFGFELLITLQKGFARPYAGQNFVETGSMHIERYGVPTDSTESPATFGFGATLHIRNKMCRIWFFCQP